MLRHFRRVVHACLAFLIISGSIFFVFYIPNYHFDKFKLSGKDWFPEYTSTAAVFNINRNLKNKSSYLDYSILRGRFGLYKTAERIDTSNNKTIYNKRVPKLILNSSHEDVSLHTFLNNDRKFGSGNMKTVVDKTGNGTERSRGHGHRQKHASDADVRLDRKSPNYCPLWSPELGMSRYCIKKVICAVA